MAAMTTALTEFSNNGDSLTYRLGSHSTTKPRLVISKRRAAVGNQTVSRYTADIVYGTEDVDGNVLPNKVVFSAVVSVPVLMDSAGTDLTDALAIFRDIVAGDEFANSVAKLDHLK